MNNFQLYKLLNFIVNKDVYAKAIGPDVFDLELKAKSLRLLRKRIGLPEAYVPGQANVGVGTTRISDKDLLPFFVEEKIAVNNGTLTLSDGWYYILDFYTDQSITSDLIGYEEVSSRLRNPITAPTCEHIVAYIVPVGLRIFPQTSAGLCASSNKVTVVYYRKPETPVFATVVDPVSLELEYDSDNSVELEWDDGCKLDILHMILQDMGLNVERGDVQQMAAKLIQQGQ